MSAPLTIGPVEQGIPLPARGRTSHRARIFAALATLNPGESLLIQPVPEWSMRQLQNRACAAWGELPGTFTSKQTPTGIRVWRIT